MDIYFHETLDPVRQPGAHTRYLAELGEIVHQRGNADGSAGGELIAMWAPIFLTGQWPQLVSLWQAPGGWDGFAGHFDENQELFHGPLERWYGERSGGFDRILIGTDYTACRRQLLAEGRRAPVVLQQAIGLPVGGASHYLARLGAVQSEIACTSPFALLGAYEVAFRNGSEVLLLWAFPSVRALVRAQSHVREFPAWADWIAQSQAVERQHVGVVLRPTDWSFVR
jgi:hypothetical protein